MQTPVYRFALLPEAADVALSNVRRYDGASEMGLVLPPRTYSLSLNTHAAVTGGSGIGTDAAAAAAGAGSTVPRTTSFTASSAAMLGFASPGMGTTAIGLHSPKGHMGGSPPGAGITHYPSVVSIATTTTGAWPPTSAATLPTMPSSEMLRALLEACQKVDRQQVEKTLHEPANTVLRAAVLASPMVYHNLADRTWSIRA